MKNKKKLTWFKIWSQKKISTFKIKDLLDINGHSGYSNISTNSFKNFILKIRKILKINKKNSIFEFGCGSGVLLYLLKNYCKSVSGYDYSKSLIKIAQVLLKDKKKITISKSIFKKQNYDIVIINSVLQYLTINNAEKIINSLIKITNKRIYIGDVYDYEKKKYHIKSRMKILGEIEYKKKYSNLNHTFYKKSFFKKIAKKNNFSITFMKNLIKGTNQGKFRYSVVMQRTYK